LNKCKYFRCHNLEEENFDCTLCYCPFYEICKTQEKYHLFGGYILKQNGLLACENCTYFHRKDIVKEYMELVKKKISTEEIFKHFVNKVEESNEKII
jgi:iron complex transport system ATP-binding protein